MRFDYDSSLAAGAGVEHIWPYTLDNGVVTSCKSINSLCSTQVVAPGLWEIPMTTVNNGLSLMDIYNMNTLENPISNVTVFNQLQSQFESHYNGNRAPFGIYMHAIWMVPRPGKGNNETLPDGTPKLFAIKRFIDYAISRPNVWIVTNAQLIQYMKNPVILI
jgi:hypothetical protein